MIDFLKARGKALILAAAALFAYFWFAVWPAEIQVANRQADLIDAIARRDTRDLHSLLAPAYSDRWGFGADAAAQAFRDVTRQFDQLTISYTPVTSSVDASTAVVTGHLRIAGSGPAFAATIVKQAARLGEPFTFEWRKTSWTPWSWRVFSIDQPELEVPAGYVPGDWGSTLTNQF
ncbi:MAG: hypothetical protein P8J87_13260 [Verrucomicrobiales bacterium]|nr:hypothetical protein [Verrucomicrobiales bacterium]